MKKEVLKKVLIIFLPLVIIGVGYFMYLDFTGPEKDTKTTEFESVVFPDVAESKTESKIEAFENAKRERKREEQVDRQASDYNFFLGVGDEEQEPEKEEIQPEPEKQIKPEPVEKRQIRTYSKPSVVKKQEPAPTIKVEKVELSRSGFTSGTSNENEPVLSRNDVIECEVYKEQLAETGKSITLRVLKDAYYDGKLIERNTFIYSKATIQPQAVNLSVNSIKVKDNFLQVDLEGYGASGNKGLTAEGTLGQDLVKEGANDAIGEVRTTINLPVVGSLSVSGAKKKANESGVPIPDGTLVYLKQ